LVAVNETGEKNLALERQPLPPQDAEWHWRNLMPVGRIERANARLLQVIRDRLVLRLLTLKFGKWAVLLLFNCVVRPADFTGDGPNRIKFKRGFGWLIAAVPASVYALANAVMAKHFMAHSPMPADDNAITHLLIHLGFSKLIGSITFVLFLVFTYITALTTCGFHKTMCGLLGSAKTNITRASLEYFLVKSTANFALFSLLCWLTAFMLTADQDTLKILHRYRNE